MRSRTSIRRAASARLVRACGISNSKVDFNWVYSWIRKPADFRPTTRMPQFFLNHEHLNDTDKAFTIHDAEGNEQKITDLEYTKRFENIEIRALAQFLLANSQPFEYIEPPQGDHGAAVEGARQVAVRNARLPGVPFARRFPDIHSTQGPDLSRVAAKLNTDKGQQWLYSWLKAPNHYHPRTAMPNLFLDPIAETDASGQADRAGDRSGGRHHGVPAERAGRLEAGAAGAGCRTDGR